VVFVVLLIIASTLCFSDEQAGAILGAQNTFAEFMFLLDELSNADGHDTEVLNGIRNLVDDDIVLVVEETTTFTGKVELINFLITGIELATSNGVRQLAVPLVVSIEHNLITLNALVDLHQTLTPSSGPSTNVHQIKELVTILHLDSDGSWRFQNVHLDTALSGLTY